ncbi:hypothetical protein ACLKA7_004963 [Drosophila subpalustris]
MLLVFFDAFTKWVELIPLRKATSAHLERAFREAILSRFGYMANRPDESSEAEGIVLGERAGHSGQYPRRPHDADYIVHSPYNSEQSRATPPNAGGGDMEAFHGADADWGSDEEGRPQRLPDSSAIGEIFAAEVNRQGAEDVDLPLLGDDEYLEVLAAAGDVEVAQDLPWEQLDWVEIPAGWRTFGLGEMIPAVVLDAVGVALPKAMAKGPTKFVVEADGRRFQIRISRAGIVTAFLRPPNNNNNNRRNTVHPYATTGSSIFVRACVPLRQQQQQQPQQSEPDASSVSLSHPGNSILVGSVSHSWVHHLTSPERDDSVPKSEPGGPGGRMRTTQRASGVSSSSSRGYSWTRILVGEP